MNHYARKWAVLRDGDGQWLYAAQADGAYIFIEIISLPDYMGRDADAQWSASVSVVSPFEASPDTVAASLAYVGLEETDGPLDMLYVAEAMHAYGAKSPVWDDSAGAPRDSASDTSRDFRSLRARARREAEAMFDQVTRDSVLDTRIVNGIGQTAREYASGIGGTWAALRRIKAMGDAASPAQRLLLQMYSKCGRTLGGHSVPEDLR